ncbi:hypothetical protein ACGFYU_15300 [Streptomyces sp. NPDC048337]|uniref:hypothetical protein n=1 Tax=Streptomyces sp. NPDC048337 TaxID=3365535 RepID=UPI00371DB141
MRRITAVIVGAVAIVAFSASTASASGFDNLMHTAGSAIGGLWGTVVPNIATQAAIQGAAGV